MFYNHGTQWSSLFLKLRNFYISHKIFPYHFGYSKFSCKPNIQLTSTQKVLQFCQIKLFKGRPRGVIVNTSSFIKSCRTFLTKSVRSSYMNVSTGQSVWYTVKNSQKSLATKLNIESQQQKIDYSLQIEHEKSFCMKTGFLQEVFLKTLQSLSHFPIH